MKINKIKEKIESQPTVMKELIEYELLNDFSGLSCGEVESNEDEFFDLIERVVYSYQENYLKSQGKNTKFLEWAKGIEKNVVSDEVRICIVEAIITFTDSTEEARSYVLTDRGLSILNEE